MHPSPLTVTTRGKGHRLDGLVASEQEGIVRRGLGDHQLIHSQIALSGAQQGESLGDLKTHVAGVLG